MCSAFISLKKIKKKILKPENDRDQEDMKCCSIGNPSPLQHGSTQTCNFRKLAQIPVDHPLPSDHINVHVPQIIEHKCSHWPGNCITQAYNDKSLNECLSKDNLQTSPWPRVQLRKSLVFVNNPVKGMGRGRMKTKN